MQTLHVGGSGTAPGFLEAGMRVRNMWKGAAGVSFLSEGLYNSPCRPQRTESSRESIPSLGIYVLGSLPSECPLNVKQNQALESSILPAPSLQSDPTFWFWHYIPSRVRDGFVDTYTGGVNCRLWHIGGNTNLHFARLKTCFLWEVATWI